MVDPKTLTELQRMNMEFAQYAESVAFQQMFFGCGFLMLWLGSKRSKEGFIALVFSVTTVIAATMVLMASWQ